MRRLPIRRTMACRCSLGSPEIISARSCLEKVTSRSIRISISELSGYVIGGAVSDGETGVGARFSGSSRGTRTFSGSPRTRRHSKKPPYHSEMRFLSGVCLASQAGRREFESHRPLKQSALFNTWMGLFEYWMRPVVGSHLWN